MEILSAIYKDQPVTFGIAALALSFTTLFLMFFLLRKGAKITLAGVTFSGAESSGSTREKEQTIGGADISWKDVMRAIEKVMIDVRYYDPDVLIGLADGMVVAGILAVNLGPKSGVGFRNFFSLGVNIRPTTLQQREINLNGLDELPDLSGKKILLVDAHIYSGNTMDIAIQKIKGKFDCTLKTLVLFEHEMLHKKCSPDIKAFSLAGNRKKVPWSFTPQHEDVYRT